jgi:hypothetical protein
MEIYMYIWAHMYKELLGQECEMGLQTDGNAKLRVLQL